MDRSPPSRWCSPEACTSSSLASSGPRRRLKKLAPSEGTAQEAAEEPQKWPWPERKQSSERRLLPRPNVPSLCLIYLLLSSLCLLPQPTNSAGSRTNEIDVDWTLGTGKSPSSTPVPVPMPSSSSSSTSSNARPLVQTKYVRLKDVLRFRCPSDLSLSIHLVPAESALLCQLQPEAKDRDRAVVGFCGPKSSDPRLILRRYSPLPGKPSFQEGQSYFFISTSDGTPEGTGQASGGLCRSNGLRLRIVVLPSGGDAAESRPADEMTDLAQLLFPSAVAAPVESTQSSTSSPTPATPAAHGPAESYGVFPAILTLEEGGQRRKVVVNSQQELAKQIEMASSQRSLGGGQSQAAQQQQEPQEWNARQQQVGRYELADSRWPSAPRGSMRRKVLDSDEEQRPAAKSVRSPDPLGESQRLVYVIGYGYDGHEHGGHAAASSASGSSALSVNLALLLLLSICGTLALLAWPMQR